MRLNQLTDEQLAIRTNSLCLQYLASCELDWDLPYIEGAMDAHFHEAKRRGVFLDV